MKCQNCGNNEANFHYTQNINGNVSEQHLCSECAEKLGYAGGFFRDPDASLRGIINDFFSPRISEPVFPSFHSFLSPEFPAAFRIPPRTAAAAPAQQSQPATVSVDETLKKRREINILREQMRAAAEKEDFEKAAEIRDQIKSLEITN